MDNIKKLIKQLQYVADNSSGGEAESARNRLLEIKKKYNIKDEDVLELNQYVLSTKGTPYNRELLIMVISSVLGSKTPIYRHAKRQQALVVNCTEKQYREIIEKNTTYQRKFNEELYYFFIAFVNKNQIFDKSEETDDKKETNLSEEEIRKIMSMMAGIDFNIVNKLLD
mgnify:CR=1 FL=1